MMATDNILIVNHESIIVAAGIELFGTAFRANLSIHYVTETGENTDVCNAGFAFFEFDNFFVFVHFSGEFFLVRGLDRLVGETDVAGAVNLIPLAARHILLDQIFVEVEPTLNLDDDLVSVLKALRADLLEGALGVGFGGVGNVGKGESGFGGHGNLQLSGYRAIGC
jgi:hypothetical protein